MEEMELEDATKDGTNEKLPENPDGESVGEESYMLENEIEEKISDNDESDTDNDDEEDADEAEVKMLQTSLADNPYDYAVHLALISKLQRMGELERLRDARENMSSKYPLSPELWLSWLKDEITLATTKEQKDAVVELCERAVKDYLSIEVWLEYLQFSIGTMSTEKDAAKHIRQLFERALTAVGLHLTKGAIIWEAFREFENILVAVIDPANQAERKEQLDRVGALFRRQLACPLLDMEKTYEEYRVWRSQDGAEATIDDDILNGGYERALAKLNMRLPYEEKLVSCQGDNELYDAYKAYFLFEKQNGDPGRIIVLYERAVADLSLEAPLWLDYVTYLETNIKIESVLEQVYQRSTRNVPWCSKIWEKWMRSYEKWNKPILDVQTLLENALAAGFSTASEYRSLWMTYLEYLRRRLDQSSEEEKLLDILRNAFNRACEHLAKCFGLEGDPTCMILQYWARTEAIHGNDMERARSLWSDILSQGHSSTAATWLEYISLERCYGDTKHLRKLYQKALSSVKDWPESIANAWLDFERDEGTLEQMELCEAKTKEKLDKLAEERQKVHQQSTTHENSQTKKVNKRKPEDTGRWKNLGDSPKKIAKTEKASRPILRESSLKFDKDIAPPPGYKESVLENQGSNSGISPPPGFKPESEDKMDTDSNHEVDDKITVFVSNLDYTATEEEIKEALKPAGPVTLFKMIRDYKGRSKGFCYVQLSSPEAVNEALKLDRTPINSRPMFVSRCDPNKTNRGSAFKYSTSLEKNKLFVKGLPVSITKEDLIDIFKVHGTLKDVRLVTYRNGHSKGLAYVDFETVADAAKALLATDGMTLQDKVISVAISQPPERKRPPVADEVSQVKSLGGTSTSRSTFGMPKTLLTMVPRNVKPVATNGNTGKSVDNDSRPTMNNQDFRNMLLNKK
ncbi:squamous cell carcinoma antigen recognized by T-cells 3 [Cephus cinctus]|uniref:Squamous cell carcinoma antigen recognized by T-cells 3 n=1 Tax=Cephus cinctus TaxID=211228 RepID=A0AAJ7FHZ1_CEPCN|nr:squamous cell carcinoma antigen recognized by T-cells 3 [Cephus cinctus]